jgi:hypothetical protein
MSFPGRREPNERACRVPNDRRLRHGQRLCCPSPRAEATSQNRHTGDGGRVRKATCCGHRKPCLPVTLILPHEQAFGWLHLRSSLESSISCAVVGLRPLRSFCALGQPARSVCQCRSSAISLGARSRPRQPRSRRLGARGLDEPRRPLSGSSAGRLRQAHRRAAAQDGAALRPCWPVAFDDHTFVRAELDYIAADVLLPV